MFDR